MKLSWLQVKNVDKIDNEMRRLPPEHISFQLVKLEKCICWLGCGNLINKTKHKFEFRWKILTNVLSLGLAMREKSGKSLMFVCFKWNERRIVFTCVTRSLTAENRVNSFFRVWFSSSSLVLLTFFFIVERYFVVDSDTSRPTTDEAEWKMFYN